MTDVEIAVYKDDILKILGWSYSKYKYRRQELVDSGVIFYRYEGIPPQKRLCAFPSKIRDWISLKSSKGEVV